MSDDEFVEYLVIGGLRHGEVWLGGKSGAYGINQERRRGKFYTRNKSAEITTPLPTLYFDEEILLGEHKYKVLFEDNLDGYDVKSEILKVTPPLKPFI